MLRSGRTAGALSDGERKLVTIVFADVSGFTTLSEKLDPEPLRDLMNACFDHLVPCIERYGGTIDKFVGDEVMALFGAPLAHENDPERALRAALEMRQALEVFNRERRVDLAVHFGVNTGLVYAGAIGGGEHKDYSVMGDPVNVAARLKALAKPGEILVGADTYRQAVQHFEWGTALPVTLKGKAEPVTAHRLGGVRTGPSTESPRLSRALSSPLVGRDDEVALLGLALDRLHAGEGGIVTVVGEAGLGKSRLVAEVREAVGEKVRWLEGRTLSFGRTISYWPLLEIIQEDSGIGSDDPEAERWGKLATRVTSLFGEETPEILPYLATLLNLPVTEEYAQKVRHLDGEAMGRQVYRASLLFFRSLARERPLVLVFEDVHWLDGSSAALLEHLLPLSREVPLLFVFVSRPETESALTRLQELGREQYADRLTEIALQPLSTEESATLVRNLVQLDALPLRLRDTILEKAEGNPFFVEEVIRSLIDLGGLVRDDGTGRWQVTEHAVTITVPDTLQGVIMARIDRLDEDLKQVLRLASVIGRTFFYRVLDSIAEAERDLDRSLADLESRELVHEKARDPELEYIFKHALVQEATYESILLQRRKEIHRKVAATIEGLFADRLEEFYSLLAYHYSRAEDWKKAQEYLFKAGDQAGSMAADAEALAHYEQAVEAYTRAFGDQWDPVERAALERKMGEALARIGEHERGRLYLCRALETLGSHFPTSSGAVRRAVGVELARQASHRLLWWLPHRSPSPDEARAAERRIWLYVDLAWFADNLESMLLATLLGLNLAEKNALDWSAGANSAALGFVCDFVPLPRLSRFYHRRGLTLAEQALEQDSWQSRTGLATAHFLMGAHECLASDDWMSARDYLHRARGEFLRLGRIRDWGGATDSLVLVFVDQGELVEALTLGREAVTLGLETGDRMVEANGRVDVGVALCAQGEFEEAEAHLLPAAAELLAGGMVMEGVIAQGLLAYCILKQGRLGEARALLSEEIDRVRKNGIRGFYARYVWRANAAAALAMAEQAQGSARSSALKEAKAACGTLLKHGKLDIGAFVPGYRMQGTHEWLRGNPRKADKWWQKSLDLADKLGARYEGALTRLEMGRRLGDRSQLEHAEAEFAAMGAAFELAEARRLLDSAGSGEAVGPLASRPEAITRGPEEAGRI